MIKFKLIIILFCLVIQLAICAPRNRKSETVQTFHRTGEAIAVDNLIQKYEREHKQFYEKEIGDGDHLEWPAVDRKTLANYCKKYLKQSIPARKSDTATGVKTRKTLHYGKKITGSTSEIVIIQCRINEVVYYITRAPEPNCVYSLKSRGIRGVVILSIINKQCDFENKPLINNPLKRKREELVGSIHKRTGQRIANDEYLLKYELEHRELLRKVGHDGKHVDWPQVMEHPNLDSYCYQYMAKTVPNIIREGVTGKLKVQKLHYHKLNIMDYIKVTTVICQANNAAELNYHITRAPETNCVYALLRPSRGATPFAIVFKYCDWEEPNNQKTIPQDFYVLDNDVIPNTKKKEEMADYLETLQLFPKH